MGNMRGAGRGGHMHMRDSTLLRTSLSQQQPTYITYALMNGFSMPVAELSRDVCAMSQEHCATQSHLLFLGTQART